MDTKYLWLIAVITTILACFLAFPKVVQSGNTKQQTCIRFYSGDPQDNICTKSGGIGVRSVYIIRPIWWYNSIKNSPLGFIEHVDYLNEPVTERPAYGFLIFECLIIYLTSILLLGFIFPEQRETENKKIDS